MAVGDVWRSLVSYELLPWPGSVNQFHWVMIADPGNATVVQIAATINTTIITPLRAFLNQRAKIRHQEVNRVWPLPATVPSVFIINLAGQRTTGGTQDELPSVCGIISRKTGLTGQKNRGRLYLPFMQGNDWINSGAMSLAVKTNLDTLATALQQDLTTTAGGIPAGTIMRPVIFHRTLGTYNVITSHTARTYSGVQRKRLGDRWP